MAERSKKGNEKKSSAGMFMTSTIFIIGGVIVAGGVLMVMSANRRPPGTADWLWWTGVAVAVLGGHLCFFSGMNREQIIEWLKSETFALTLALLIRWPIAEPYRIPSGSMEPTFHGDPGIGKGDRVFVNKWIYGVRYPFMNKRIWHGQAPQRWDIVVFKAVQENAPHKTLVKRIVGMPGEHIQIKEGKVFANGKALELPPSMPEVYYTSPPPNMLSGMMYGVRPEEQFSVVPEGHYLVLGDNSANSGDGRYFGWLPEENIVGRVACIWWPPTRWRDFTGFSETTWWHVTVTLVGMFTVLRLLAGRSWVNPETSEHLLAQFLSFGCRIPFTRWWLAFWGRPRRGMLVLYQPSSDKVPGGTVLLGRVAALPGEKVTLNDGTLLINDAPVTDVPAFAGAVYSSNHPDAVYGRSRNKAHTMTPDDCYFILADPAFSVKEEDRVDSRVLGWITCKELMGKAVAGWWPVRRIRKLQ